MLTMMMMHSSLPTIIGSQKLQNASSVLCRTIRRHVSSHSRNNNRRFQVPTQQQPHSTLPAQVPPTTVSATTSVVEPPSRAALQTLFISSAIPMIGFGFMDNIVMIQAGQYIDSTIGVSLGLATLTAAACGQVVSDVSGVLFGGTLERLLVHWFQLVPVSKLSTAQRGLSICRNIQTAGAAIGVMVGCAVGAVVGLWSVDLEAKTRLERARHLQNILIDMLGGSDHDDGLPVRKCKVFLRHDLHLQEYNNNDNKTSPIQLFNFDRSNPDLNKALETQSIVRSNSRCHLYAPVVRHGQVHAVISLSCSDKQGFTDEHIRTVKVMARHVAICVDRLTDNS